MAIAFASRARARRMHPAAEPNMIPFIDVLLVLLIIFMVTSPKPTTDLRLDLPSGGRPIAIDIAPTIIDVVRGAGGDARVLVDGQDVAWDTLTAEVLQHISAQNGGLDDATMFAESRVYVRADMDIAYTHVVEAIDTLQHDGFEKVSVFAQSADH